MDDHIKNIILSLTESKQILNEELIQNLWSGYGQLKRVTLDKKSIILKLIKYPSSQDHPKGWNSDISHNRKVKSYQVEQSWYKNYNENIRNAYFPKYISSGELSSTTYLILEDLLDFGFSPKNSINWDQVKLCLKWLATFHAKNLGVKPNQLWEIGTYWHLETRPDELEALEKEDYDLKNSAPLINKKLNSSKFQTIVHGDAKLANFLFNKNEVAAVDFQYVGGGVGVKDVAYFLSSIYNEDELSDNENKCLNYYFKELIEITHSFNPSIDLKLLETDWRELYSFAWCDFLRFLKGWSPKHFKINSYSEKIKKKVLNDFK